MRFPWKEKIRKIVIVVLVGLPLSIVLSPWMLILFLFQYIKRKRFEKKYAAYLLKINGENFFCYNNRKKTKAFIEEKIIPHLPGNTNILFVDGKEIKSDYERAFISEALNTLKNYSKFPHLIKVREGKWIDKSINNHTYNAMNMNQPVEDLIETIVVFFKT